MAKASHKTSCWGACLGSIAGALTLGVSVETAAYERPARAPEPGRSAGDPATPTDADQAAVVPTAEPVMAVLQWPVDAEQRGCASAQSVRADVDHLLDRAAFDGAEDADVVVRVRLVQAEAGWLAQLSFTAADGTAQGERELHSPDDSCRSLDGPVALVVALMLEASRPQAKVSLPAPALAQQASPWQGEASAALVVSGGLLPGLAFGPRLTAGVVPPGFVPLRLSVTLWPAVEEDVELGRGGRFSASHGDLSICPELASGSVAGVGLCLGAGAGVLSAVGTGLGYTESPDRLLVQGEAAAQLWLHLGGPFLLELQAGAAVPFIRPNFVYTDVDGSAREVHQSWPVIPKGSIGLGFRVPPDAD